MAGQPARADVRVMLDDIDAGGTMIELRGGDPGRLVITVEDTEVVVTPDMLRQSVDFVMGDVVPRA
jgi:hypothetical protein